MTQTRDETRTGTTGVEGDVRSWGGFLVGMVLSTALAGWVWIRAALTLGPFDGSRPTAGEKREALLLLAGGVGLVTVPWLAQWIRTRGASWGVATIGAFSLATVVAVITYAGW